MKKKISLLVREEGGAITAMTVIMMVAFVGILAVVIDLGHLHTVQNELRNAADACALRGARAFYADTEPYVEPADDVRAVDQAKATIVMNYSDNKLLQEIKEGDIKVGVWDFTNRTWLYLNGADPPEPIFTWPPNPADYGKVIGPGISLKTRKEGGEEGTVNSGPVIMTLASILEIFKDDPSVAVRTDATAALSPAGKVEPEDWTDAGEPPPIRLTRTAAADQTKDTFNVRPTTTQDGGWHYYDNPPGGGVPFLEDLIWGRVPINTLTAGESMIRLDNGTVAKLFAVPDPNKNNDQAVNSFLNRWLTKTGRTVDPTVPFDSQNPTYIEPETPIHWNVWLPVTDDHSGDTLVVGWIPVEIRNVYPAPDASAEIIRLGPVVAPPGIEGGGEYFGLISQRPVLVK